MEKFEHQYIVYLIKVPKVFSQQIRECVNKTFDTYKIYSQMFIFSLTNITFIQHGREHKVHSLDITV